MTPKLAGDVTMTNEEWIKSLPTEVFASFLNCKGCSHEYEDAEQDKCFAPSCEDIQIEWLKSERIEKCVQN